MQYSIQQRRDSAPPGTKFDVQFNSENRQAKKDMGKFLFRIYNMVNSAPKKRKDNQGTCIFKHNQEYL